MIRVGAAPISWGASEVPDWGVNLPWELVLDQMHDAGYAGTELGPPDYLPVETSLLRNALDTRGLALASAFVTIRFSEPEHVEADLAAANRTGRLLVDFGATCMVVADAGNDWRFQRAGAIQSEDGLGDSQWNAMRDALHRLARDAASLGLRLAFHSHAGTFVETRAELDRLAGMTDVGEVGLCLDTGHLAFGGADPVDVAKTYASRITHLHLKDVKSQPLREVRAQHLGFREAVTRGVFCEIGDGEVDFPAVRASLQAAHYDGWLIVEQDVRIPAADSATVVRLQQRANDNRENVRELFGV